MKAIRLVTASDEYDTAPGFVIKGTRDFEGLMADRNGLSIAHDILEHQNGARAMGPVWDELEALGAIWYVRGRHGDMMLDSRSIHGPETHLASDVTRMFAEYVADPDNGPGALRAGSRAHDHDEDFSAIIEIARGDIPRENNDMGRGEPDEDANGWNPELHALFETYLTLALHRMRLGFRKAQRRFERRGASRYHAGELFQAIKDAVAGAVRDISYEGQEFVLRYGNGSAFCREFYEGEF